MHTRLVEPPPFLRLLITLENLDSINNAFQGKLILMTSAVYIRKTTDLYREYMYCQLPSTREACLHSVARPPEGQNVKWETDRACYRKAHVPPKVRLRLLLRLADDYNFNRFIDRQINCGRIVMTTSTFAY